ncbi:Bud site selection protein 6 [Ascochyta lentis]
MHMFATRPSPSPTHHPFNTTIRVVASPDTPRTLPPPTEHRTPTPPSIDSSTSTLSRHTHNSASLSLRPRHETPSSRNPTRRARGNTAPSHSPHTPEPSRYRSADAESVLSFTPSVRGKQLAGWFSGLLGR